MVDSRPLRGRRVAILATDGVEQLELLSPRRALIDAGALVDVVSPRSGSIQATHRSQAGETIRVDQPLYAVMPSGYDALILPGGVANPDALRIHAEAVRFVRGFVAAGKPIAAICHGAWTLIEADGVRGRTLTSWPSLRTDLTNAGALWVDRDVVSDNNLVTSRKADDLAAFNRKMIERFATRSVSASELATPLWRDRSSTR